MANAEAIQRFAEMPRDFSSRTATKVRIHRPLSTYVTALLLCRTRLEALIELQLDAQLGAQVQELKRRVHVPCFVALHAIKTGA